MIIDLPPQIQNIPPKPAYAVIQPALPNNVTFCWQDPKSICRQSPHESEHFGGYSVSGTAPVSLASGTTQNMTREWIPWEGKIPSLLVQFDYKGHLLEIKPELTAKKA
ncbi:hypothetical protein HYU93_01860 [Candidatus Daviesbacteria bacterium]|nr:hypothetical protein [Candidatus Daviesbacteria bacterium]